LDALTAVLFYFLGLFIVCGSGIWLSRLLLFSEYSKYRIIGSFPLGIAWLILVSSWASYMGFSFNQSAYFIIIVSLLFSLIALTYDFVKKKLTEWLPAKADIYTFITALISGIIVLFPVIFFNALRPYVDGFTYISIADYLQDYSYYDKADPNPYKPWLTQMSLYQHFGFRMGAQFILSLFSVIFQQHFSIYVFMPLLAISQYCFVLGIWLLAKIGLKMNTVAAYLSVLFAAFYTSIPIVNAYDGFMPQNLGLMLSVCIFALITKIDSWKWNIIVFGYSILLSALIVTYSELLPFVGISMVCLFVYKFLRNKPARKRMFINVLGIAIVTVLCSNISLLNAFKAILSQLKAVVGWHIDYSLWEYILYLLSIPVNDAINISSKYPLVYMGIVFGIGFSLYMMFRPSKDSYQSQNGKLVLRILSFPYLLLLGYFVFVAKDPWVLESRGHTWSIYKNVQYISIFVPIVIGMSFYPLYEKGIKYKRLLIGTGFCFVIVSLTLSWHNSKISTQEMRNYTGNSERPLYQYELLYKEFKKDDRPINIVMPPQLLKHKQMLAYFLRDHEVISDWSNDGYIFPHMLPENRAPLLVSNGVILKYNPNNKNGIAGMEVSNSLYYSSFISGVYDEESNGIDYWRWASGEVVIEVNNISNKQQKSVINFDITSNPLEQNVQNIHLWSEEKKIATAEVEPNKRSEISIPVNLDVGKTIFTLKYSGDAIQVNGDPRNLAFNILNFGFGDND